MIQEFNTYMPVICALIDAKSKLTDEFADEPALLPSSDPDEIERDILI